MADKIKVLIVDDSAIVRSMLLERLSQEADIEVVGTAPDPFIARDKIVKLNPDVVTLDIEMPRMDGLTFLEKLMNYFPIPVIIVSSVTTKDQFAAVKALELGAFDVVNKPGGSITIQEVMEDILYKIRQASTLKEGFIHKREQVNARLHQKKSAQPKISQSMLSKIKTTDRFIAIGASTGGTVALEYIFKNLPANLPPILVVQHMPPNFTHQFAERLNGLSELNIQEAGDGDLISPGTVYVAPGGWHLTVERQGASVFTKLIDTERVHFQKPAVDVMFHSVAQVLGKNAAGFLLTGMGKDGADGMLAMKNAGSYTVAQDEASSVVWGMPRTAVEIGAAVDVLPLESIPSRIVQISE